MDERVMLIDSGDVGLYMMSDAQRENHVSVIKRGFPDHDGC